MTIRLRSWAVFAGAAIALAAAAGYLIGSGAAIGKSDADRVREESFRTARDRSETLTRAVTSKRGYRTGLERGRAAGERVGAREARNLGSDEILIQAAEAETATAQAAAAAARSEISARQANCGVVARAPGWCPTAGELASFRAAVRAARDAREEAMEPPEVDERGRGGRGGRDD